ncbi:Lipase [Hypsizygus marmoreus]|uniref:Lipase n=1 Tax=Hypsizygus marmoreus TaxID=39966 RepID=A0A369JDR9_HYPMA|nr:Lipase [Hypsizygus marmoreus]
MVSIISTLLFTQTLAVPLRSHQTNPQAQTFMALSASQIASFTPFTSYASTAYCHPSQTLTWSCGGTNCDAKPNFHPIASGGDGEFVQFWASGDGPKKLWPLITDADSFLDTLDQDLFPGIGTDIEVHNGFAEAHAETANSVLDAVKTALETSGFNQVTLVGHSLGAAPALLDVLFLPFHLPGVKFRTIGYGMPWVGNKAFANYVDAHVQLTHVDNKQDIVPILPGRFLGFRHPQRETHIQDNETWITCPGMSTRTPYNLCVHVLITIMFVSPRQDNTDKRCTVGDVRNIFQGSFDDHSGKWLLRISRPTFQLVFVREDRVSVPLLMSLFSIR